MEGCTVRNLAITGLICLSAMTASAPGLAAISDTSIATCSAIKGDVQRLACFDKIADDAGLAEKTTPTKTEGSGKWYTATKTDPLNDKPVYTAALGSEGGTGRSVESVVMLARCADGKTELFVNWSSFIGTDDTDVTYRIGKSKAITRSWQISTDNTSTFYPGSPIKAMKEMMESDKFIVNVTPYSESPVTAIFDISGAEAAFADIRKGCSW
nr:type VI secretion system-associated protein TagO [Pseudomonas syringae]